MLSDKSPKREVAVTAAGADSETVKTTVADVGADAETVKTTVVDAGAETSNGKPVRSAPILVKGSEASKESVTKKDVVDNATPKSNEEGGKKAKETTTSPEI
jgi:hypothetical protein